MSFDPLKRGAILDLASFNANDLDLVQLDSSLDSWRIFNTSREDEVIEHIGQCQVVVSNKVQLTSDILCQSPSLRLVCVAATGYNNIDIAAAQQNGVTVCNVRDYATPSVVQHVFLLMLSLYTNVFRYQRAVSNGHWNQSQNFCLLNYPIHELAGKTLGIIGYGVLGKAVEKMARAFEMTVLVAERKSQTARTGRTDFNEVISNSDFITLHCPLNLETHHLIGEEQLQQMKSNAIVINCARGGIVDEEALLLAVKTNQIGGAGVDVLTEEPPVKGNPLLDIQLPNLIVTPHIAWASRESRQRMIDQVVQNIAAFKAGKPQNIIV